MLRKTLALLLTLAIMGSASMLFAEEDWDDDFGDEGGSSESAPAPEISAQEVEQKIKKLLEEAKQVRYQPVTKRDPFVSLIVEQNDGKGPRPKGFPGFNVAELKLSGVWMGLNQSGNKGFFEGADGKSYTQQVGDRCFNGKIISIRPDRVIFEEYQQTADGKPRPPKIVTLFISPQAREQARG